MPSAARARCECRFVPGSVRGPLNCRREANMKRFMRFAMLLSIAGLALFANAARADEIPIVTGVHWTKSTEEQKKVYLIGIANMAQVEMAYQKKMEVSDTQSVIPRMARGLKGQTLDTVREGLNKWYAANPGKLDQPVLETIWFEMVVPGLQKNK
jgi:hypothetical protein